MRLVLFSFILLSLTIISACGDNDNSTIPVGTVLPGGYTVTESVIYNGMLECVLHAKNIQASLNVREKSDTSTDTLYTAGMTLHDGSNIIQTCTKRSSKIALYSSAKK